MTDYKLNPQKDYIKKVQDITINPLKCSNAFFNTKTNQYQPGKRYSLNKFQLIDYLTVGSNQLVFELDARAYSTNYKYAGQIIDVLQRNGWPFYIFSSGGKGIHIECWFDKPIFKNKEIVNLLKESISYNLSFKQIRLWLWNVVLNDAGIREDLRGIGKAIDSSCLTFDDLTQKSKLLRLCGGRKQYFKSEADEHLTFYKTFIPLSEFKKSQIKLTAFDKVKYPEIIKTFKIDESGFGAFLDNYITQAKNLNIKKLIKLNLSKSGGYMNLESVQKIRQGLSSGKRSLGAQVLAIAMVNDNISIEEQKIIIEDYVSKCSQMGDIFTIDEAMYWVNWINLQPVIFWNCSLVEESGLHDEPNCEICQKKNREALKLLKQSTLLKTINEVLDMEIIGEYKTKMLMFLLSLSKNFYSKTGKPEEWTILPNDPMSQNIILSSDSASGKTHLTKKVLDVTGEKNIDYFFTSRITKSVLNYYTTENMDGKVIFIEELQGLDEHTEQLRVWMSEGELNLETVEKVTQPDGTEKNDKVKKTTKGQPVFITNQAEGKIEEQLNNRSWVLGLDTSDNQTKAILKYQTDLELGKIKIDEIKKRNVKDALKQLRQYHFKIPFADEKMMNIPYNDVRSRRDYTKFLTLIKCIAYLHQYQREIVEENGLRYIICDIKDYDIARQYADEILGATFSGLTNAQINLINYIKKTSWKEEFNISDIMRNLGKTSPHWRGQLEQLNDLGYVTAIKQGMGNATLYTLNEYKTINIIELPSGEDLLKKQGKFSPKTKTPKTPSPKTGQNEIGKMENEKPQIHVLGEKFKTENNGENNVEGAHRNLKRSATMVFKTFLDPKQIGKTYIGGTVLGVKTPKKAQNITRTDIIQYAKKSNKQWIDEINLMEKWPEYQDDISILLKQLTLDGTIYRKGGKFVLL